MEQITTNDPTSKTIYQQWLEQHAGTDRITGSPSADMRAALVEHFRDNASILIATEAAAEGINLQFCNLVVNYDPKIMLLPLGNDFMAWDVPPSTSWNTL